MTRREGNLFTTFAIIPQLFFSRNTSLPPGHPKYFLILRNFLNTSIVYISGKREDTLRRVLKSRGRSVVVGKKVSIGIMLAIFLMLVGCAGYTRNYRYDPYNAYYHYPYGYHGAPYGYQGHGYRGGWQHY